MAEVKWIKIVTDIFNNQKIRIIESMPEGDAIIVIWFKLLMLAGNINEGGNVFFTRGIPYTDQMLSTLFNRPVTTVQLALNTFEEFNMIDIFDGVIHVSNWEKYQNVEGMDKIREQTRARVAKYRENKRLQCNATCNVTATASNAIDIDKEKEKDKKEKRKDKKKNTLSLYEDVKANYPLSENMDITLTKWFTYRDTIRKPLSDKSIEQLIEKVIVLEREYGYLAVAKCFDNSIDNGYQGVFFDKIAVTPIRNNKSDVDDWFRKELGG